MLFDIGNRSPSNFLWFGQNHTHCFWLSSKVERYLRIWNREIPPWKDIFKSYQTFKSPEIRTSIFISIQLTTIFRDRYITNQTKESLMDLYWGNIRTRNNMKIVVLTIWRWLIVTTVHWCRVCITSTWDVKTNTKDN